MGSTPGRYAAGRAFPPYAFVSPFRPHPNNHPEGHSFGRPEALPAPLDPGEWRRSEEYRYGVDLFNHGFYWEAHEAWEGLWHAAGRAGPVAELLKGLIKLAAAGVKVRQGMPRGVRLHAGRALGHFAAARAGIAGGAGGTAPERMAGLAFADLEDFAREVVERADALRGDPGKAVEVVFERRLAPE